MGYPPKGRADYLKLGDWNAACSMCGCKRKASELVLNWQGQYRCPKHNEPRQPQDFVRAVPDIQAVPWAQDESNFFIDLDDYIVTQTGIDITTESGVLLVSNFAPPNGEMNYFA